MGRTCADDGFIALGSLPARKGLRCSLARKAAGRQKNKSNPIAGDRATYRVKTLASYCKAFDESSSRQKFLRCNTIVAHPLWFLVVKPTSKQTSMAQVRQTDG
jgi:hypothetical protein